MAPAGPMATSVTSRNAGWLVAVFSLLSSITTVLGLEIAGEICTPKFCNPPVAQSFTIWVISTVTKPAAVTGMLTAEGGR